MTGARARRKAGRLPTLCLQIAVAVLLGALPISAWAHREATGREAPADSIAIPNLSHGQMAVIANNRAAILDLAARQIPTDPTMRRLEIPGSVEDESSPFNECSHAYLAATRALLLHLQTMPGDRAPVQALIAKIEREMLDNSASLILCRYSDEPFNTAERITPRWRDIPFHLSSSMTFAGLMLLVSCACIGIRQVGRPARA